MKLKKGDFKYLLLITLLWALVVVAIIYTFNTNAESCDLEKGYQCDASQVFQYNKKVD